MHSVVTCYHQKLLIFQGEWKPKQIPNPDYKGPWIHPEIDNPDYVPDENLYKYENIGALGFDLWQVCIYTQKLWLWNG